jgi:hypothetical protein
MRTKLTAGLQSGLLILLACTAWAAYAAEPKAPAKMEEPMAGKMKKPGMKQGDVKKQAEKKRRAMKPMLEKEEKEMRDQPSPAGAK